MDLPPAGRGKHGFASYSAQPQRADGIRHDLDASSSRLTWHTRLMGRKVEAQDPLAIDQLALGGALKLPIVAICSAATVLVIAGGRVQAQSVWKCTEGGRTVYSNTPCPSSGSTVDPMRLQGNVVDGVRPPPGRRDSELAVDGPDLPDGGRRGAALAASPGGQRAPVNTCPSDQELRNMETAANSTTRKRQETQFLQEEVRRARQCRNGQGSYTAEDWRISREAQADQNSISASTRKGARIRTEGMHSAADAVEGDRIAAKRRAAEAAAAAAAAEAAARIIRCDQAGCTTADGRFYPRGNSSPGATSCRISGNVAICT